jgi:hypothetical protein
MIRSSLALLATVVVVPFAVAKAESSPQLVPAPIEKVFVPQGFDDNDNTEVVLHGHFPNTCYKVGPVKVEFGTDGKTITLEPQAYRYTDVGCAQVLVPFVQTARLGILNEGTFQIRIKGQPEVPARALEVAHAHTQSPDDYLYAPVQNASLKRWDDGTATLKLEGSYPYMFIGCMMIKEIKTTVTSDNVLVVQPVTEIYEDAQCGDKSHEYVVEKDVGTFAAAEYMIHVRTLDGIALNRLVDLTTRND